MRLAPMRDGVLAHPLPPGLASPMQTLLTDLPLAFHAPGLAAAALAGAAVLLPMLAWLPVLAALAGRSSARPALQAAPVIARRNR